MNIEISMDTRVIIKDRRVFSPTLSLFVLLFVSYYFIINLVVFLKALGYVRLTVQLNTVMLSSARVTRSILYTFSYGKNSDMLAPCTLVFPKHVGKNSSLRMQRYMKTCYRKASGCTS